MPNPQKPKKLTKAEIKAAQLAAEREELAASLIDGLLHHGTDICGDLTAILGYLANGEDELADTASRVLMDFLQPLAPKAKPGDADTLDYDMLKTNRQKLSTYRTYTFQLPALNKWTEEKDCHSDKYIKEMISNDPDTFAYFQGLQDAVHRVQFTESGLLMKNSLLISRYEVEAQEELYSKCASFDGEEAFGKLTAEEMEAWKAEWEPYFREQYHEENLADMLLSDTENLPISIEERNKLQDRWGINWHIQWTKHWISYKPDREEFHRIQSGELTQKEWDAIEAYYKADMFDIDDAFADIDNPGENKWEADWKKNKQTYRDRYFKEVWGPKWIADWEQKHDEVWHDAPEFDEEAKENEDNDWYDCWTHPDDNKYLKDCWIETWKNNFRRMDSFLSYTVSPTPLKTAGYKAEQELLQKAEKMVKDEEQRQLEQSLEGLSPKAARARKRQLSTEADFKMYDRMYEVFTHANLSFLTTKQYQEVKKAMEAALDSRVNPKIDNRRGRNNANAAPRWTPKDQAFNAMFKMIPFMDKTEQKLIDLMSTDFVDPREYTKVQENVKKLQKILKQGCSTENMQFLISHMMISVRDCQDFMDRYPKKFFHWTRNKRYKAVKTLRDECTKQLRVLKAQMENAGHAKAAAAAEAAEKRRKAQEALEAVRALQNAPAAQAQQPQAEAHAQQPVVEAHAQQPVVEAHEHPQMAGAMAKQQDYAQRQQNIREGVELVHKLQQERKSVSNQKQAGKANPAAEVQNNKRHSVNPKMDQKMVNTMKKNNN